jgi:glycosyltransferase involved in cell wall biosynthesis
MYPSGLNYDSKHNIEILRFKPWFRLGATVIPRGLLTEIRQYSPEIVLVIGIAKLFPNAVFLNRKKRDFLIYSFFGENKEYYKWHNLSSIIRNSVKFITRIIFKRPFYNLAIKCSDKIFLYTPETYYFLCRLISKTSIIRLKAKYVNTSLGFDSSIFYYDVNERNKVRHEEGISDQEFVILTVSRYSKSKSLEFMIDEIIDFKNHGYPIKYWIIGFNTEDSLQYFRGYLQMKNASGFITCFPYMDYEALRKYQSAADLGLWCQVTISIQQSMGTGLPLLLEEKKSVSHLLNPGSTGLFFIRDKFIDSLNEAYKLFKSNNLEKDGEMRKKIEKTNHAHFSYQTLIRQIISS